MDGTLFDYLEWRGDLSLRESALNEADALVFCALSYLNYGSPKTMTLREAYLTFLRVPEKEQFRGLEVMRKETVQFIQAASLCGRFREVLLTDYTEQTCEETDLQFSAVTFLLPDRSLFIAFRGTDSSLVGWKEDFEMSFLNGTAAQREAAAYAARAAAKYPGVPIRIGGHSKGGNLAVWAAANLPEAVKERLQCVYCNDGPGFPEEFIRSPGYASIRPKLLAFVPEASVIGILMAGCAHQVIKSSNRGVMQHDPFSWRIIGTRFVCSPAHAASAKRIGMAVTGAVRSLDPETLTRLNDGLFRELRASGERTVYDLNLPRRLLTTLPRLLRATGAAIGARRQSGKQPAAPGEPSPSFPKR